jgi:hypothetical protein
VSEWKATECVRRPIIAKAENPRNDAAIARKQPNFVRAGGEIGGAQVCGMLRGKAAQEFLQHGRTHGMDRSNRSVIRRGRYGNAGKHLLNHCNYVSAIFGLQCKSQKVIAPQPIADNLVSNACSRSQDFRHDALAFEVLIEG